MSSSTQSTHYDEKYWEYQSKIGQIGGFLNKFKFEAHIHPKNVVMDYGCGGGYLLNQLTAARKIGFEVNPNARAQAESFGIETVDHFLRVPSESVDIVISNHAMEHVPEPLLALQQILRVLRPGGLAVIVLPCEQPNDVEFTYKPDDINQHLYTWCPQSFGNLLKLAGFQVENCEPLRHTWTPDYQTAYSQPNYHERCRQYAMEKGTYQIKAIARKSLETQSRGIALV